VPASRTTVRSLASVLGPCQSRWSTSDPSHAKVPITFYAAPGWDSRSPRSRQALASYHAWIMSVISTITPVPGTKRFSADQSSRTRITRAPDLALSGAAIDT
jgi:hypothetical protein